MLFIRLALVALSLTVAAHAQTGSVKTPAQLNAEINAHCPDNIVGLCTPFIYRQDLLDIIASTAPRAIVPTSSPYNCAGNGSTDDTVCMQAALNAAVASGVPLLIGQNGAIHLISSPLTSSGVVHIEGFAPVGNDGVGNAQRCLNGLTAEGHNITLLNLTGPKVIIHNLCMQMGTPGTLTGGLGAAISLSGSDQGHDDITGNTIFWPHDGIQVGPVSGFVRASNISHNVIRSPARYGIAIGMGTTGGATAGITMIDNQIGCDSSPTGTGLAIFDGAVIVDGTNNGPNNCVIGTAIIPGNQQNVNGQFRGVMGDSNTTHDLLIAPTETGGIIFGGVIDFLDFTQAWAASVTNTTSVLVNCPANTYCEQIIFNGLTAHGGVGQTLPIVDLVRGAGGPINLSLLNSTICEFGAPGGGAIGLKLTLGNSSNQNKWTVNNNRIGQGCFGAGGSPTSIGISIVGSGSSGGVVSIIGNNVFDSATPISYTPTGEIMIIANNLGVDNACPNVASGTTISLPNAATCVHLTGVTTVTGISNSAWVTRTVRVIADSGLSLNTGGSPGFCNASVTLTAKQQSILTWDNEDSCWLHTP